MLRINMTWLKMLSKKNRIINLIGWLKVCWSLLAQNTIIHDFELQLQNSTTTTKTDTRLNYKVKTKYSEGKFLTLLNNQLKYYHKILPKT